MDNVLKVTNYGFKRGMVFCDGNLSIQVTVTYHSNFIWISNIGTIYMLMFLKNNSKDNELVYKLDLRGIS